MPPPPRPRRPPLLAPLLLLLELELLLLLPLSDPPVVLPEDETLLPPLLELLLADAPVSLNRLLLPRFAPRLDVAELLVAPTDDELVDDELVDDELVSVFVEVTLMLGALVPLPPMPPRPLSLRLPRICGAISAAKRSAAITPVTRTVL